eukprot:5064390-Lingulodinium_polyedra.AAC.1
MTADTLRETLENWESLHIMTIQRQEVALHLPNLENHAAATAPHNPATPRRTITLLSLCDGTGMARVGLEDLLRMLNARGALTANYFSELDPALAEA